MPDLFPETLLVSRSGEHIYTTSRKVAEHFASAIDNDTLWRRAKENVIKPAGSWTFDVLKEWLKAEIVQGLPTIRRLGQ